ncbi:MAG: galactokinase [Spirochaetaceae bacterium]|jgi:galactokinase|nr:galactokinase [Spirochaetaceae bacterium]
MFEVDATSDITLIHQREYEITDKNERIAIAEAPGRIHFLGEHSQIGSAMYLSAGIDLSVEVALSPRKDNSLRFFTAQPCERKRTTVMNIKYKREDRWANHIKLALCLFADLGFQIKGMNWTISSTIPQNVSLAAAESIEVAAALALKRFFKSTISDRKLIEKLSEVHNSFYPDDHRFVDYIIMLEACKDTLLVVDEAALSVKKIKSPFPKYRIIIVDSKVPFVGIEEELKIRREQLRRGLEILTKKRQAKSFRDFIGADLIEVIGDLDEEVRRRSMHAIKELSRITDAARALEEGDLPSLARTIFHSHESLRDLYEVTCPELDWLVKRAQEIEGVLGARMTGKGFGGCIYVILPPEKVDEYLSKMEDYERIFGFHAVHYEVKPGGGARTLK